MTSRFHEWDLLAQAATDMAMAEQIRITPTTRGGYTGYSADTARAVVLVQGVDFTADSRSPLSGAVRGDENRTGTTFEDYQAHLWFSKEQADAIGYALRKHDIATVKVGTSRETAYEVIRSERDTEGNLLVHVTVRSKPS